MSMAGNAGPSLVPRQARIVVASARIGRTGSVGGFFDLLADLLHVLGGTLHRVAGNQEVGGKQREQGKGDDALHGTLLYEWGGPQGKSAARVVKDRKSVVSGKSVSVRVDLGGRRIIKKKTYNKS